MNTFNVAIDHHFKLVFPQENPNVLILENRLRSTLIDELSLEYFLEHLPVFINDRAENVFHRKERFLGNPLNRRHGLLAFVQTPETSVLDFLSTLSYKEFAEIEHDIRRLVPDFKLSRKFNVNLKNVETLFRATLTDTQIASSLQHITVLDEPISSETFEKSFICANKHKGHYILPFRNMETIPGFKGAFQKTLGEYPAYIFSLKGKKIAVAARDGMFELTFLHNGPLQREVYPVEQISQTANRIRAFFEEFIKKLNFSADYVPTLSVEHLASHMHYHLHVKTPAQKISERLLVKDDFTALRKEFKTHYDIKGRSRIEIYEQVNDRLAEKEADVRGVFIANMSPSAQSHPYNPPSAIQEHLDSLSSFEQKEQIWQISMHESDGVVDMKHRTKHFADSMVRPFSLYRVPDFVDLAEKAPSFEDILNDQ